jgi:hypothetical protein
MQRRNLVRCASRTATALPDRAPQQNNLSPLRFFALPASHMHCLSDKLSNPYAKLTLDQSTKFIDRDQANVWKACHIVISAHGDKLWRTQVFFSTNFAIAELHELLDLQGETSSSRVGNFNNNTWKRKFKI